MSRRVAPPEHDVLRARDALLADCAERGLRPSVLALARTLGLTNTTFWRNYPEIARELADARRVTTATADEGAPAQSRKPAEDLAALRRDNHALRDQLDLAAASIARLALENNHLRDELRAARGVRVLHREP